ncbi:MAG: hypothetical protein ACTHMC_01840 [Pseudobacter sp.]|uniref:hypothetical protein n=1 Tax=Pseudobacter sp. TaxID=2045420 RepID=UPI003F80819D
MNFTIRNYLQAAALAAIVLPGCKQSQQQHTVEPAFYYWKSQVALNATEQNTFLQQSRKMYVKFFDVAWNAPQQRAMPVA